VDRRNEIEQTLRRLLVREESLRWAYLFGSAARGDRHRDVDLAVMPRPEMRLTDLGRLQLAISAALRAEVDLVDLRGAPLPLVGSILRQRQVLLDREPEQRHEWEAETTSRVLDYEPVIARYSALRREKLRLRRSGAG
jgi:predicted nucleotidyltransferase